MKNLLISLSALAAAVVPGHASTISVANFSFENPALPTGTYTGSSPSNQQPVPFRFFSGNGTHGGICPCVGVSNPGVPGNYGNSIPDGNQVAFMEASNSTISGYGAGSLQQNVGTLAPDTIYTLSVFLGERINAPLPASYGIQLIDGTNQTTVFAASVTANTPLSPGVFTEYTISFDSANFASNVGASHQLAINLTASDPSLVAPDVVLFDDVYPERSRRRSCGHPRTGFLGSRRIRAPDRGSLWKSKGQIGVIALRSGGSMHEMKADLRSGGCARIPRLRIRQSPGDHQSRFIRFFSARKAGLFCI